MLCCVVLYNFMEERINRTEEGNIKGDRTSLAFTFFPSPSPLRPQIAIWWHRTWQQYPWVGVRDEWRGCKFNGLEGISDRSTCVMALEAPFKCFSVWRRLFCQMLLSLRKGLYSTSLPPPITSLPLTYICSNGCVCFSTPISSVSCDLCSPFGWKARSRMWYVGAGGWRDGGREE